MAALERGILPITDRVEIRNGVHIVVIEIEDWLYRASDAVSRVLESLRWEESGQKTLSETPKETKIEVIIP